ncbi:hypothetical protein BH23GEM9_BH23GEM9_13660 [soil metagenome]
MPRKVGAGVSSTLAPLFPPMPDIFWFLLAWSGFAATCAAALLGALTGGLQAASWSLLPTQRSALLATAVTLLVGTLVYPLLYGAVFELAGRADIPMGAILGAIHAAVTATLVSRRNPPRVALRVALMHLVYGVVIAFLYVTP